MALVMVRDDFWMAASRFMRDLEIRLKEGDQVITAELAPASTSSGSPAANPFSGGRRFP